MVGTQEDAQGTGLFLQFGFIKPELQKTREDFCGGTVRNGRYWDRTSDLFGVNYSFLRLLFFLKFGFIKPTSSKTRFFVFNNEVGGVARDGGTIKLYVWAATCAVRVGVLR